MGKVITLENLAILLEKSRDEGKKIVHCHGCFDLMHPGHIKHFQAAKRMGHILVVTVTPDIFIDKGPGRPAFNETLRVESIAALECVDYAAINKWPTAEETLRLLKPTVYVKGQEFETQEDRTGKLHKELKVLKEIGCQMSYTHDVVFSSTKLLNDYFLKRAQEKS
jgi:rfaE bifunctional protein nucleotidyltransferase chain/domain